MPSRPLNGIVSRSWQRPLSTSGGVSLLARPRRGSAAASFVLPMPDSPSSEIDDRRAAGDLGERVLEHAELGRATDERRLDGPIFVARVEHAQHVGAGRPLGRIESRAATTHSCDRSWRRTRDAPRRPAMLLAHHDLERRAVDRQPPGQRLVQHHADRVPIGRGPRRPRHRLLGRHVRGRADDASSPTRARARRR